MTTVIKVENISKQYRLGNVGTGSLAHDINRAWYRIRGKEDPYLKIGQENDRTKKGDSEYVWALRDINFEVKQGEVLGIIGRNGAGKSTLLKILSRTTSPTTGEIKLKGRVASLLEVGTGFHPELTGRENIFLNGAILGMTKKEIKSKFDEIVDFAGVERYIDTPVKRYSSGMYVRLAFGVAAHLEPEILIVDEVLAVGDAEFQKKALGKMKDVSGKEGRTVLFVSHNMASMQSLCERGILLENGFIATQGIINEVLLSYKERSGSKIKAFNFDDHKTGFDKIKISGFEILDHEKNPVHECYMGDYLSFKFCIKSRIDCVFTLRIAVFDEDENRMMAFDSADVGEVFKTSRGEIRSISCKVNDAFNIKSGRYKINISLRQGAVLYDHIADVATLNVLEKDVFGYGRFSFSDMPLVLKKHEWL